MASVSLSRRAQTNLRDLADWIARDNPDAALSFITELRVACTELRVACTELSIFPRRFPKAPQLGTGIRRRTFRNYHIIYRLQGEDVVIVAIVHAARDPNMSF